MIKTKQMAMVNILGGQVDLVPEFVPWYGSNDAVAKCALDLLRHPEKLEAQRARLRDLIQTIDRQGASMNVANMAIAMMDRHPRTKKDDVNARGGFHRGAGA